MRCGLVGTSEWAEQTHVAALSAAAGVEFVGLWGRDASKAGRLAARSDVTSFRDVDALLDAVDAVVLSVPPDVQAVLAERAARAGKHLLLEKPLALSAAAAAAVATAVREAQVSSRVFFTWHYTPEGRAWLDSLDGSWEGGTARWFAGLAGGPHDTPWRRERGALWDLGPHVLSMLTAALGPVEEVAAVGGAGDLVHLVLSHRGGATSTASLTLWAPPAAHAVSLELWGPGGTTSLPISGEPAAVHARTALEELVLAQPGQPDSCDAAHGALVVELLDQAQRQLDC